MSTLVRPTPPATPPAADAPPPAVGTLPPGAAADLAVTLAGGALAVRVARAELPLEALCGFASRRNPKRGFLFVSKVLGRHIPVRPAVMRDVHERLAARLPADAPGPILCVGLAETAIALGQGVADAFRRRTGRDDVLFLHSTRYHLTHPLALTFVEAHSHATDHRIYAPAAAADRVALAAARTLVLVDDEASTGSTFLSLAAAAQRAAPALEQVVTVVITDWCGPARRRTLAAAMPLPHTAVSLLEGEYRYAPDPTVPAAQMPNVVGRGDAKDAWLARDHGRLGGAPDVAAIARAAERLAPRPGERILVLGSGEFVYPPFLLAERLEAAGADVQTQATTRSPALVGHAIGCALAFRDNYGDDIPNFLYNARRGDYDRVVVCHETPAGSIDPALLDALGATALPL